jgi:hypothetical protein
MGGGWSVVLLRRELEGARIAAIEPDVTRLHIVRARPPCPHALLAERDVGGRADGARERERQLPHHKLVAFSVTKELLLAVLRCSIRDAKLRDEAVRSAKSACLNTAEGAGRVTRADLMIRHKSGKRTDANDRLSREAGGSEVARDEGRGRTDTEDRNRHLAIGSQEARR